MKYIIKKRNKVLQILDINYPFKGYKFKSNSNDIKSINIIDNKLIDNVLNAKIKSMFTKLLMIVNDAFNSDDNPEGVAIALDEIAMVKTSILNKYHQLLKQEKEELYLKKLALIEEEMNAKMFQYQIRYVEKVGKSR